MSNAFLTATFRKKFPGGPEIAVDNFCINRGITVLLGWIGNPRRG
jgi:hypothetical protein